MRCSARLACRSPAWVESVTGGLARGGGDRVGAADRRERRLATEPLDVLAGGGQHLPGVAGGDPQELDSARSGDSDQLLKLMIERGDLLVEGLDPPRE